MAMHVRYLRGRILIPLLLVMVGSLHSAGGALHIDECEDGWMEIEETSRTAVAFTCQGLGNSEPVTWQLIKNSKAQGLFKCGTPAQQCNSTDPDILVSRPSATVSVLNITMNQRLRLENTSVTCLVKNYFATCMINVIAPASVSQCKVTINKADWKVTGNCVYEGAFASNGTYRCVWHQVKQIYGVHQEKVILGNITKIGDTKNNKTYFSGRCFFTTQLSPGEGEGDYPYSVHFFPGPEEQEVQQTIIHNQATTTLQTNEVVTGGGLPVPYIAGGAAGAVVIIVVVVVVIIACRRRRRRRRRKDADFEIHVNPIYGSGDDLDAPTTTTTIPSTATTTVSASPKCTTTITSAPISTASTIPKPSAAALCIPAETSDQTLPNDPEAGDEDDTADIGYSTLSSGRQQVLPPTDSNSVGGIYSHVNEAQANMSMTATPGVGMSSLPVDADPYTSIDDAPCDFDTHQDPGDDGYSTAGFTCNQSLPAPSGDEYAVVNHPESIASESADHNAGSADICDNTYSQVKRDSSRGNTARASISADCSNVRDGDQPACDEDYAVVDKSRTRKGSASTADVGFTETVADVSARVDKNAEENNSIYVDNSPPSVSEYVYAQVDKTSTQNIPATSDNVSLTTKKD